MKNIPKILAIDYGTQRIGTALSFGSLAEPYLVLPNSPEVFVQLQQICADEAVERIVVGISENTMAEQTKTFVTKLKQVLPENFSIVFADETLSSYTVTSKLKEAGKHHIRQKGPIDHFAAAEFLQEYLDMIY